MSSSLEYIRPVTLIALMFMFMATMIADSMDSWPFNVKDSYVSLLEDLDVNIVLVHTSQVAPSKNQEKMIRIKLFN